MDKNALEALDKEDIAVSVQHVDMHFNMSKEKLENLKEYFIKLMKHQLMFEDFVALRDVTFDIKRGDVFGIVGFNGAGKSTLLKVICGVLKPTKGTVLTRGTIAPMIELGAGFDMDLTARENIYLNGSVLGYSKKFMDEKFNEIVEFSEMQDFLDTPMKNYSSGMVARIAFAIATVTTPDILIVDEILSVGDFKFQQKCEKRINEMMEGDTTVIMVSHSMEQIDTVNCVTSREDLIALQKKADAVFVSDEIYDYIVSLTEKTRQTDLLMQGISPRGSLAILKMAKAYACYQDRDYVIPQDIHKVFFAVSNHRMILSTKAKANGHEAADIVDEILNEVPIPALS